MKSIKININKLNNFQIFIKYKMQYMHVLIPSLKKVQNNTGKTCWDRKTWLYPQGNSNLTIICDETDELLFELTVNTRQFNNNETIQQTLECIRYYLEELHMLHSIAA